MSIGRGMGLGVRVAKRPSADRRKALVGIGGRYQAERAEPGLGARRLRTSIPDLLLFTLGMKRTGHGRPIGLPDSRCCSWARSGGNIALSLDAHKNLRIAACGLWPMDGVLGGRLAKRSPAGRRKALMGIGGRCQVEGAKPDLSAQRLRTQIRDLGPL
jgi:hypothetical protein